MINVSVIIMILEASNNYDFVVLVEQKVELFSSPKEKIQIT